MVLKGYLLEWQRIYSLGSPIIAVSQGNAENTAVVQSSRLGISIIPRWWWSTGAFLKSCWFSICIWIMKKLNLIPDAWQCINKADELAYETRSKQEKYKSFQLPCPFMWNITYDPSYIENVPLARIQLMHEEVALIELNGLLKMRRRGKWEWISPNILYAYMKLSRNKYIKILRKE